MQGGNRRIADLVDDLHLLTLFTGLLIDLCLHLNGSRLEIGAQSISGLILKLRTFIAYRDLFCLGASLRQNCRLRAIAYVQFC